MDQATIDRLKVLDKASQEANRAALHAHREAAGQVSVKCKCGAESVLDAKRPERGPKAKCGICGEAL